MLGRSALDPRHRLAPCLARVHARCIEWATASQVSAQICANVRRAKELVDSQSDGVYMEPSMDCEKVQNVKNNVQRKYILNISIIGKYFWVLRVRFYFMGPKRMPKTEGVYPRARLSALMSAHTRPSYCTHLLAAGQLLAAAGACATARTWLAANCGNPGKPAHGWQPCAGYPLFYCTRTPIIRVRVSEVLIPRYGPYRV